MLKFQILYPNSPCMNDCNFICHILARKFDCHVGSCTSASTSSPKMISEKCWSYHDHKVVKLTWYTRTLRHSVAQVPLIEAVRIRIVVANFICATLGLFSAQNSRVTIYCNSQLIGLFFKCVTYFLYSFLIRFGGIYFLHQKQSRNYLLATTFWYFVQNA